MNSSVKTEIEAHLQEIWLDAKSAQELYGQNTLGLERKIGGCFRPRNKQEIQAVVDWARRNHLSLFAFSTGRNWGYGSSMPARDHSILVDLSRMNKILDYDEALGLVTVEPGVTQKILFEYLREKHSQLMVPTTGAGPDASILGNALDKGVGITPIEDHYSAVMALEAILADGSTYKSTTQEFGGSKSDAVFKWKTGPILEGLFVQSSLGIVTQATIALAKRPEHVEQYVALVRPENMPAVVDSIRRIRQTLGSVSGGINLMDQRRVFALMDKDNKWPRDRVIKEEELSQLRKEKSLEEWVVIGALYGTKDMVRAAKKVIVKELKAPSTMLRFLNPSKIKWARRLLNVIPLQKLRAQIEAAAQGFTILEGKPSIYPLKLAYLRNKKAFESVENPNPDEDQCGLIWFAPLLPMEASLAVKFNQRVSEICLKYNFDPIVTFIAISERCFDCTIPILFDRSNPLEIKNAFKCREELLEMAKELGVFPHRMDIEMAQKCFSQSSIPAIEIQKKIKAVLDPQQVFISSRD